MRVLLGSKFHRFTVIGAELELRDDLQFANHSICRQSCSQNALFAMLTSVRRYVPYTPCTCSLVSAKHGKVGLVLFAKMTKHSKLFVLYIHQTASTLYLLGIQNSFTKQNYGKTIFCSKNINELKMVFFLNCSSHDIRGILMKTVIFKEHNTYQGKRPKRVHRFKI